MALCLTLLPGAARAADDVEIIEEGDGSIAGGKYSYLAEDGRTLTLKDFCIAGRPAPIFDGSPRTAYGSLLYATADLPLVLEGKGTLTNGGRVQFPASQERGGNVISCGLYVAGDPSTTSTLTVRGALTGKGSSITISGLSNMSDGSLTSTGVHIMGSAALSGDSTLNATARSASVEDAETKGMVSVMSYGVSGAVTQSGGNLTAVGDAARVINAKAGSGIFSTSCGVCWYPPRESFTLSGGTLTARSGGAVSDSLGADVSNCALAAQPTLNVLLYWWRNGAGGSFTRSDAQAYTWSADQTYVELRDTEPPQPSKTDGDSEPSYSPVMNVGNGGSIRISPRTPNAGDDVTLTPNPDEGFEVEEVTVTDRSGDPVAVTDNGDGTYTFEQPRGRVTIEVTFREVSQALPFTDVPEGYWACDEIAWANFNGYMSGTSAVTFSPESTISRQQVWMILARLSGAGPANMAEARIWAIASGISDGTMPGGAVTRQQLAVLLFRFAQANGYDNGRRAALTGFPDAGSVSDYAAEALQWAAAGGIIGGTSQGTLNPRDTATRAQFAAMLYRLLD